MSSLVSDLQRFKDSSMSPEEMAKYLILRLQLSPEAFTADEPSPKEPVKAEGKKRGRRKASEISSQEESLSEQSEAAES